jgi:hypothetical protein
MYAIAARMVPGRSIPGRTYNFDVTVTKAECFRFIYYDRTYPRPISKNLRGAKRTCGDSKYLEYRAS